MVTLAVTAEVGRRGVEEMSWIGAALFIWTEMKATFLAIWDVEKVKRGGMGDCYVVAEGSEGGEARTGDAWLVIASPVGKREGVRGA